MQDDRKLLKTICEGRDIAQQQAMHAFDALHRAALRRHLLNSWRSLGDQVDDVLQEVFLKVWLKACSFRGAASARTWLYRIARNYVIDENRKPGIDEVALPDDGSLGDGEIPDYSTEEEHAVLDRIEDTLRELYRLEPQRAEALRLMYVEGFSGTELAEVLQRPLRGTFEYLNQCRAKFRGLFVKLSARPPSSEDRAP